MDEDAMGLGKHNLTQIGPLVAEDFHLGVA